MQPMAQDAPATNRCAYGGLHELPAWQSPVSQAFSLPVGANVLFAIFQPLDTPILQKASSALCQLVL